MMPSLKYAASTPPTRADGRVTIAKRRQPQALERRVQDAGRRRSVETMDIDPHLLRGRLPLGDIRR